MFIVGLVLMLMGMAFDVGYSQFLGTLPFKPHLTVILLFYIVLRFSYRWLVIFIITFLILVSGFTGVKSLTIFLSYFLVLSLFYKVRTEIYIESYLLQAFWVLCLSFATQTLLVIFDLPWEGVVLSLTMLFWLVLYALIMALLSIPVFVILDLLFDFFIGSSRDSGDQLDWPGFRA